MIEIAQATNYTQTVSSYSMMEIIQWGLAWVFIAAFFLTLVFVLYGGISFILSGGQEEKVKSAVATVRYAIIGLIVTILSMVVVSFIGKQVFGVDLMFVQMGDILNIAGDIVNNLVQGNNTTVSPGGGLQ